MKFKQALSSLLKNDLKTFKFWFGYGSPIFLLLTLVISFFYENSVVFWGYVIISQLWWWESLLTTCRRCPNYGTTNCGIQGVMTEKLLSFRADKLPLWRINTHLMIDICYVLLSVIISWKFFWSGALSSVWALGALYISFKPKRYHGLLFQTK